MTKCAVTYWEYSRTMVERGGNGERQLNNMGREGWELVTLDDGYGVFKRAIVNQPERQALIRYWNGDDE